MPPHKIIIPALTGFCLLLLPVMGSSQELKPQMVKKELNLSLYPNGKIFIQNDTNSLILTYRRNGQTQQETLYNNLPKDSVITFAFSEKIDQNTYLFVMTKNRKVNQKEKTDGYDYSLQTFVQDSHGKLQDASIADINDPTIANDAIGRNLYLNGFDGIQKGSRQKFEYKTSESIREYLKTSILHGPLKTDLYPEGKMYFQGKNNLLTYPVSFILEYNDNGNIKKETIDQYDSDLLGSGPHPANVTSVFFHTIQNKPHIFVIVDWEFEYDAMTPRNGNSYQIYSYTKDQKGNLKQDTDMMNDPQLSGYSGTFIYSNNDDHDKDRFVPVNFQYTTTKNTKKYLDQLYNFAIIQGPFPTNFYPEGKIYFQAQQSSYKSPINFILEYKQNGQNKKETIDQYQPNTTTPEIASVFTCIIHEKPYIFTIIKWKNDDFGYDYKVYGYTKNKNDKLTLDQTLSDDPRLRGFLGYNSSSGNKIVKFHYESAGKLKKYLNQKYNKILNFK